LQRLVLSAWCSRLGANARTIPPLPPWRAAKETLACIRSDLWAGSDVWCVRFCVCICAVFCSNRPSDAGVDFYGRPTDVLWFNIERRVRKRIAIGLNLAWICHFTSLTTHLVWPEYIQGQTWPAGASTHQPNLATTHQPNLASTQPSRLAPSHASTALQPRR
jgi:hypothetical protein